MSEPKPGVFISYSHKDEEWKSRLVEHLGVLADEWGFDVWDDARIGAGDDWKARIEQALNSASIAVLLVSRHFLTSRFIKGEEVPPLPQRRAGGTLAVIPVIVAPCAWEHVEWLRSMQARPRDGRALSSMKEHAADKALSSLVGEIHEKA